MKRYLFTLEENFNKEKLIKDLTAAGLKDIEISEIIWVAKGSALPEDVGHILNVSGVVAVEPDIMVSVPPPGSEIQ